MSGLKKGPNRKPAAAAGAPRPTQPKSKPNVKTNGGGGSGSVPKSSGAKGGGKGAKKSVSCFVKGCTASVTTADELASHYEQVFSTNDDRHVNALTMQLDPHFSDATHCQICGEEFLHSGILLQHVFTAATAVPGGLKGGAAKEFRQMHKTLFESFVSELIMMPTSGDEHDESVEYLLSLTVPDFDADDNGEDDDYDDDDDDAMFFDGAEDEEDGYGEEEPSMDDLAEFQEFLAAHGLDMNAAGGGGKKGKGGMPGGLAAEKAFMKHFMSQMGGEGMGMEMEEEFDDDDTRPKGKKKGAATKGKAAPSAQPAAAGQPGELQCDGCQQFRPKAMYSAAQIKKKAKRRCKVCVGDASADGATGTTSSSASASATPTGTPSKPSASTASASKPAAAASASSSATKPSSSASASASSKSHPAPRTTLHAHHLPPRHADGTIVEEEPEETGDGLYTNIDSSDSEAEENGDDEDEDDEEEELDSDEELYEDDEDDGGFDPFEAMFGGGGRSRKGARKPAAEEASDTRKKMNMHLVVERPGQLLAVDRRMRLKASDAFPIRSYTPRYGSIQCHVCHDSLPSRLVKGWKLACFSCAVKKRWVRDEDRFDPRADDAEHDPHAAARRHAERIRSAKHVALQASRFPNYRAGVAQCVKPGCTSAALLVVYDEQGDEWVICTDCYGMKQKLRYFDQQEQKLVDAVQEPLLEH